MEARPWVALQAWVASQRAAHRYTLHTAPRMAAHQQYPGDPCHYVHLVVDEDHSWCHPQRAQRLHAPKTARPATRRPGSHHCGPPASCHPQPLPAERSPVLVRQMLAGLMPGLLCDDSTEQVQCGF
jgi:hypothetical protein